MKNKNKLQNLNFVDLQQAYISKKYMCIYVPIIFFFFNKVSMKSKTIYTKKIIGPWFWPRKIEFGPLIYSK